MNTEPIPGVPPLPSGLQAQPSALETALAAAESAAQAAVPIASVASPVAGTVAEVIAAAFGLVVDLVKRGHDPVVTITRIRDALPEVQTAEDEWERRMVERFPR